MSDPILETLTFALESDLQLESVASHLSGRADSQGKSLNRTLDSHPCPSAVILGQHRSTPCLIPNCDFISQIYGISQSENTKSNASVSLSPKNAFLKHLLEKHNFVIDRVDQIANLHKYILYWKEKFSEHALTDYCVAFLMNESSKQEAADVKQTAGESEEKQKYFMISDVLPEDKELRGKLWTNRLELVLEANRKEREQNNFVRQCIFCKHTARGNRSSLFQHMASDHSFHIGQPDNLVFVEELFDYIDDKLNRLVCIYCEKVFKDKSVLREHMRKKQHKRINPTNPEYDRFYVVNYLEPGKTWKVLDDEDPEDDRIEEEWVEVKEEGTSIVCLFCTNQSTNFDSILSHMITDHKFDFKKVTVNCDFYQKVKIVNFIRRCVYQNVCMYCQQRFLEKTSLLSHLPRHGCQINDNAESEFPSEKIWNQVEYFFPTYENDQFLILLDKDNSTEDDAIGAISSDDESNMLVIPEDLPFTQNHSNDSNNLENEAN